MEPYYPCTWLSFVNRKNEKRRKLYLLSLSYYFSKQVICILYTYSLDMQTTKTSSIRIRSEKFNVWQYYFQILIWAIALLSFISVSILCEFAILPDVYILLYPQEEKVVSSSWGNKCTDLAAHSSKILNPLPVVILAGLGNT